MPSGTEKKQGTFTERYILPYSLIVFYGIVNENAAKTQNIPLAEEDVELMIEAMWNGTKNLISGSKFGQMPRLLLQVIYKEGQNYHIGELDKLIARVSEKPDEAIRDISEIKIDITELMKALTNNKDRIEKIRLKVDDRIKLIKNNAEIDIKNAFSGFGIEELPF
jgi:CRISPR-associated protein Csh2